MTKAHKFLLASVLGRKSSQWKILWRFSMIKMISALMSFPAVLLTTGTSLAQSAGSQNLLFPAALNASISSPNYCTAHLGNSATIWVKKTADGLSIALSDQTTANVWNSAIPAPDLLRRILKISNEGGALVVVTEIKLRHGTAGYTALSKVQQDPTNPKGLDVWVEVHDPQGNTEPGTGKAAKASCS
jgi:hypothetical protein